MAANNASHIKPRPAPYSRKVKVSLRRSRSLS